jgi:hypothetical protein
MSNNNSGHNEPSEVAAAASMQQDDPVAADALARLEQALDFEADAPAPEHLDLQQLREEIAGLAASFKRQLEEANARSERAEAKLTEQSERLNALGQGREDTMRELQETRAELAHVAVERDRLQTELTRLAGMQTETIALTEEERDPEAPPEVLPTLDELMANWSTIEEAPDHREEHVGESSDDEAASNQEMISPQLVFTPEDFREHDADELPPSAKEAAGSGEQPPPSAEATPPRADAEAPSTDTTPPHAQAEPPSTDATPPSAEPELPNANTIAPYADAELLSARTEPPGAGTEPPSAGTEPPSADPAPPSRAATRPRANSRVLVFLDADPPIKYPLYKDVITIGRSEVADIRVDGDSVSRIHARIVAGDSDILVEDAGSKNGIEVNSRPVLRHKLQHGDVLSLGTLHFTFVDTAAHAANGNADRRA